MLGLGYIDLKEAAKMLGKSRITVCAYASGGVLVNGRRVRLRTTQGIRPALTRREWVEQFLSEISEPPVDAPEPVEIEVPRTRSATARERDQRRAMEECLR